tara:strand:- start:466 stop:1779 length:1314 start_codon:yes stop_codon:yes gene_type:complete
MSKFELNIANFLVLSIPIFLISGAFLADLALSVSCILFLFYVVRKRRFSLLKDNYFFIFLFFYTIIIISCFQSDYFDEIFLKNVFYFRFGIFLILVKHIINNDDKFIINLKNILLLTFVLLFADSLIQYIFGKNILGFTNPPGRITSLFGDESVLGSYVVRLCPLLIALIFLSHGSKYEFFLVLSLTFILSIISGERASIFLFLVFCSILFLIWKYDIKKKLIILSTFIFFILISFTIVIKTSDFAKFRLVDQTLSQINLNYKNNKPFYKELKIEGKNFALARNDTLLPLHYTLYFEASKNIFLDNLIFGSGPKSYRHISKTKEYLLIRTHAAFLHMPKDFEYPGFTNVKSSNTHPHNIYFQLFSETGLLGGLFIFLVFIYVTIIIFFSKTNFEKKIILISIFMNLFPFITSGNFLNNWISIIYFYPLGILYLKKVD